METPTNRDQSALSDGFQVLGIRVNAVTTSMAMTAVRDWADRDEKAYLVFCTVSSILSARGDSTVRRALDKAALVTPDGMPLVWLGRRAGLRVGRVYGPDFMLDLMETTGPDFRHFFYGGAPGVAEKMVQRLRNRFPELVVAGTHSPAYSLDPAKPDPSDLATINDAKPDIVWVGLGHPKQDLWMFYNQDKIDAPVLAGVGAAFDFHSGTVKEAPTWMKRSGFQWLHRLASDPKRLWRRYLIGNTRFLLLLIAEWIGSLARRRRSQ